MIEFLLALTVLISFVVIMNLYHKIKALKGLISSANTYNQRMHQTIANQNAYMEKLVDKNSVVIKNFCELKQEVESWKAKSIP